MIKFSDIEIVESVLKGNKQDYSILINRYKDKAFTLTNRIIKNNMDSEEVLQDAFVKAFFALNKFKRNSTFSTWFYKIVYNSAISYVRSKKAQEDAQTNSFEDYSELTFNESADDIYKSFNNVELLAVIDRLPLPNSVIVILHYIDNLSLGEIAEILNLSTSNVKVILHRSRKALKTMLVSQEKKGATI